MLLAIVYSCQLLCNWVLVVIFGPTTQLEAVLAVLQRLQQQSLQSRVVGCSFVVLTCLLSSQSPVLISLADTNGREAAESAVRHPDSECECCSEHFGSVNICENRTSLIIGVLFSQILP